MAQNPLFRVDNSPTKTTRPTKAVNEVRPRVPLTHNTFDNSFFNFKTQRYGLYEPFWWKVCVAGDKEPFSNSHNVRSLPFVSPLESPMTLNKDYFQVPMYAIQPNTWDYIFKSPSQGDDVPYDAQNLFPLVAHDYGTIVDMIRFWINGVRDYFNHEDDPSLNVGPSLIIKALICESFFSSGCLLFQMGYKLNPSFLPNTEDLSNDDAIRLTFDEVFDTFFNSIEFSFTLDLPASDGTTKKVRFSTSRFDNNTAVVVDKWTAVSLLRSFSSYLVTFGDDNMEVVLQSSDTSYLKTVTFDETSMHFSDDNIVGFNPQGFDCIRMDVINAYQLACSQYYVNPRVDFIYNAQLYRDNWISQLRDLAGVSLSTFDYNGIPVLYDYFSLFYYMPFLRYILSKFIDNTSTFQSTVKAYSLVHYLFGFREQLKFGDYFNDSRTQALGYGEEGSDKVDVMDDAVDVIDISQKLVINRFRSATAKLDNTAEDYLATIFKEQLPPDYHYPKFIVHSEFAVDGSEVANTTSDNQGNIVTNLKSGADTAEFNIDISVPSILLGVSYIHIPRVYTSIKERAYMHEDRYDMFIPMLQYFGDQEIYRRELADDIEDPTAPYGYVSRNGEFKQRVSQASGAFLTSLRSWLFVDKPSEGLGSLPVRLADFQSPIAIRAYDWEFNRFLPARSGISLGTGFHFIMKYNNKNVDQRPMEVNPLTLYPNQV